MPQAFNLSNDIIIKNTQLLRGFNNKTTAALDQGDYKAKVNQF
jgi:hypothetical protein